MLDPNTPVAKVTGDGVGFLAPVRLELHGDVRPQASRDNEASNRVDPDQAPTRSEAASMEHDIFHVISGQRPHPTALGPYEQSS
jgi:hypothetical protein